MKKMLALLILLLTLCASSAVVCADGQATAHHNGEQIELYLGGSGADLPQHGSGRMLTCSVDDPDVATVQSGKILPVSEGLTYITCTYQSKTYVHNVIVHEGFESITEVLIDGQRCESGSFVATVGKTYQLSIGGTQEIDPSKVRIRLKESYKNGTADDFVRIDRDGKMTVLGVGEFEVRLQSATNLRDTGCVLRVSSSFQDRNLKDAVSRYFDQNHYRLSCGAGVFTVHELAEIDHLVFTSCSTLSTQTWSTVLPKLEKITFDLRNETWSTRKSLNICADPYVYEFIGTPEKSYSLTITADARESLQLCFSDFLCDATPKNAINLKSVGHTTISFFGACAVRGGNGTLARGGSSAIIAQDLTLEIGTGADVIVWGGNGGSDEKNNAEFSRAGATAIIAENLTVRGIGYADTTALTVVGGDGGNGYGYGEYGGEGGKAIFANEVLLEGNLSFFAEGGSGGDGRKGANGEDGADGENPPSGSFISPKKGDDGEDGQNGTAGGNGGNGAHALFANSCSASVGVSMKLTGGSGGRGGDGGRGGNGGNGASDTSSDMWTGVGDPGCGGRGGDGGEHGVGGLGADATNLESVTGIRGSNGATGRGGLGGYGGAGGNSGAYGNNGANGEDGDPTPPKRD